MPARTSKPARKPRADAQKNRDRILEIAKEEFTRSGPNASLEEKIRDQAEHDYGVNLIARRAGVGPGTLYRHFPTRDALIEALYQTEVGTLAAAADRFVTTLPPLEALRAWMLLFIDYVAAQQIIAPALNSVFIPEQRSESSRNRVHVTPDSPCTY